MKKLFSFLSTLLLVASFATPAQSAGAKYKVYQKTLATFSSTATTLTSQQKAQVKATVDANPDAEKFICTGIRYYSQPMSVNIMVRKRAKAACDYAKQLNPELSTWYQNKPTQARSYAGKVLLTVKARAVSRNGYNSVCDFGKYDAKWKAFYEWDNRNNFCLGPTAWVDAIKDADLPASWKTSNSTLPLEQCKLRSPDFDNGGNNFRGFPNSQGQLNQYKARFPQPGAKVLFLGSPEQILQV